MDEIKRIAQPQIFTIPNKGSHISFNLPKNTREFTIFARTPDRTLRWRYHTPHELYATDGEYFTIPATKTGRQRNIYLAGDTEVYVSSDSNNDTVIEVAVYHGV